MTAMVEVRNVQRTYGAGHTAVHALQDISLSVGKGELVALVGRSGSGKTTLLNIIGALDRPDAGDVLVDGTSLVGRSDEDLDTVRRDTVAFIFQGFGLIPEL